MRVLDQGAPLHVAHATCELRPLLRENASPSQNCCMKTVVQGAFVSVRSAAGAPGSSEDRCRG